jgi:hypothetical protein
MKSTPWRKTFKSAEHMNKWTEQNSADTHGTRYLKEYEIPEHWKSAGYHEAPEGAEGRN